MKAFDEQGNIVMYWVGSKEDVVAAEQLASNQVVGKDEFLHGMRVDPEERVTTRWAEPFEVSSGIWAIPVFSGINPKGVTIVKEIAFNVQP